MFDFSASSLLKLQNKEFEIQQSSIHKALIRVLTTCVFACYSSPLSRVALIRVLTICVYLLQLSTEQIGTLPGPVLPSNVTGELDLTQSLTGGLDNGTAATRGYTTSAPGTPYFSNASQVG